MMPFDRAYIHLRIPLLPEERLSKKKEKKNGEENKRKVTYLSKGIEWGRLYSVYNICIVFILYFILHATQKRSHWMHNLNLNVLSI